MVGVSLRNQIVCSLLLGEAEELLHLIVVVEADNEHGVVLVMIDHVGNTDTTSAEEGNSMAHVVPTDNGVIGKIKGLLGSHEVERVVALPVLLMVADDDPDLMKGIDTDIEGVLHLACVCVVCGWFGSVLELCSRMKGTLAFHLLDYKLKIKNCCIVTGCFVSAWCVVTADP
jgi:hypothetical protein